MKFLCLAYGGEAEWLALTGEQQNELLAQDEVLRQRGDAVAAVSLDVATVRSPDGNVQVRREAFAKSERPLAGFGIIEARDLEDAIRLVANTPCARAGGAVELRKIQE